MSRAKEGNRTPTSVKTPEPESGAVDRMLAELLGPWWLRTIKKGPAKCTVRRDSGSRSTIPIEQIQQSRWGRR